MGIFRSTTVCCCLSIRIPTGVFIKSPGTICVSSILASLTLSSATTHFQKLAKYLKTEGMKIAINICHMQICRSAIKSNYNKYCNSYRTYHFVSIDIYRHPVIEPAPSHPDAADFSRRLLVFVLPLHLSSVFRVNSLKEKLTRVPYSVSSSFMSHCKNCALMIRKCDKGTQWVVGRVP